MVRRIRAVLSPGQPFKPRARSITCHAPEIHPNGLVNSLGLAIRLRMECSAHLELNSGKLEQITPYMSCKHWIAIRDYRLRQSMKPDNLLEECPGDRGSRVGVAQWYEMGELL